MTFTSSVSQHLESGTQGGAPSSSFPLFKDAPLHLGTSTSKEKKDVHAEDELGRLAFIDVRDTNPRNIDNSPAIYAVLTASERQAQAKSQRGTPISAVIPPSAVDPHAFEL